MKTSSLFFALRFFFGMAAIVVGRNAGVQSAALLNLYPDGGAPDIED
jgi:hypothetical protein